MCQARPGPRCSDKAKPVAWVAKQRGMTLAAVEQERAAEHPRRKPVAKKKAGQQASPTDRTLTAIRSLAKEPGGWVSIVDLRQQMADLPRAQQDAILRELERRPDVSITPEANQKTLTQSQRDAAIVIGLKAKHYIAVEG